MKAPIRIEAVSWHSDAQTALRTLRRRVFITEQGVPPELEWTDEDGEALHLLAFTPDGAPVATARMLPDGHIGRVAVLPEWRRRGIATALLERLITTARGWSLHEVWLDAQTGALPLYEKLGFVAEGDEFLDAGIPHRRMRRRL